MTMESVHQPMDSALDVQSADFFKMNGQAD